MALAPQILEMIPMAALAGILVVIGYRLADPREFVHTWHLGKEEFIAMVVTILLVVGEDLLVGVAAGVVVGLIITLARGSRMQLFQDEAEDFVLKFHGPLTFANYVGVRRKLDSVPTGSKVILDFSDCTLIDHTVVQRLHDFEAEFRRGGGQVERVGASHLAELDEEPLLRPVDRAAEVTTGRDPTPGSRRGRDLSVLDPAAVIDPSSRCHR